MKEVTLFEVTQQKILIQDGTEYLEYARMLEPQHRIIGSPDAEYMVDSEFEVHTLPIKRLSRVINYEQVLRNPLATQPVYEDKYYAITKEADEFMRVSGYYDEHVALKKALKMWIEDCEEMQTKLDELTSTTFFGRLKMLFTGIK